jgi:hypothetical protein
MRQRRDHFVIRYLLMTAMTSLRFNDAPAAHDSKWTQQARAQ